MNSATHPLNVFKYCPRCGSSDFPVSGPRSFRCGNCGLNYYINAAAAVAALIFDETGKLLLTRRAVDPDRGKLDLPGGFVDPGETAEQAVCRELKEELGIEVKKLTFFTSHANEYLFSGLTVFTTDLAFRAEAVSLDNLCACDDISGFEWVDPREVDLSEIPAPSIRFFVEEACK